MVEGEVVVVRDKDIRIAMWAPNLIIIYGVSEGIVGKKPKFHKKLHEEMGFIQCLFYETRREGDSINISSKE